MALEIPTFENMKKVMFYDVLMKLCHQTIKYHQQREHIDSFKRSLRVFKRFGAKTLHDDTLEAIHSTNVTNTQNRFTVEFAQLLCEMRKANPRADLVRELAEKNKILKSKFNHLVDTNIKIMSESSVSQE